MTKRPAAITSLYSKWMCDTQIDSTVHQAARHISICIRDRIRFWCWLYTMFVGYSSQLNCHVTLSTHQQNNIAVVSRWVGLLRYDFRYAFASRSFGSSCGFGRADYAQPNPLEAYLISAASKPFSFCDITPKDGSRRSAHFYRSRGSFLTWLSKYGSLGWGSSVCLSTILKWSFRSIELLVARLILSFAVASAHSEPTYPLGATSRNIHKLCLSRFDGRHYIYSVQVFTVKCTRVLDL